MQGSELTLQTELADYGSDAVPLASVPARSKDGRRFLTAEQILFAQHFVLNGGNATDAARSAGYKSYKTMAQKCMLHPLIGKEIKRLMIVNVDGALPLAIKTLVDCLTAKGSSWKERIAAANTLVKLAGIMPKGPSTAVQVNVAVNGQEAQNIIGEVWDARERRIRAEERKLSGISDSIADIEGEAQDVTQPAETTEICDPEPQGRGGDVAPGPAPAPVLLPSHSSAEPSEFPKGGE